MQFRLKKLKIDTMVLVIFFVGIFAYMPTARPLDRYVWLFGFLLLLINSFYKFLIKKISLKIDKTFIWFIAFFSFAFYSAFWSKETSFFKEFFIFYFWIILISFLCISIQIETKKDLEKIIYICVFASVYAAIRYSIYTPWNELTSTSGYLRGTFGSLLDDVTNYNGYAQLLTMGCLLSAYLFYVKDDKKMFFPYLFLFIIVIFAGSRKNLFVIPMASFILVIFSKHPTMKKMKVITIFVIVSGVCLYMLFSVPLLSNIKKTTIQMINGLFGDESLIDESTSERMYLIEQAKKIFSENFIKGVGFNNYMYYNSLNLYAHNNYYEILATLGLIGFCIYYSLYIYILMSSVIKYIKNKNPIFLLNFCIIIAYMIQELGAITIYSRERLLLLMIVIFFNSFVEKKYILVSIDSKEREAYYDIYSWSQR